MMPLKKMSIDPADRSFDCFRNGSGEKTDELPTQIETLRKGTDDEDHDM